MIHLKATRAHRLSRSAPELFAPRRTPGLFTNTVACLVAGARALVCILLAQLCTPLRADGSWTEFRGPRGDGSAPGTELPLRWSETNNVKWKTEIHDRGWSTPVIWGNQIWLTTATADGRQLFVLCLDRETGRIARDLRLFEVKDPEPLGNEVNCYASPSPAIEEGRVFVHFGSYGTAALDTTSGKTLWERRDLPCRHFRGPGSSPVLFGDFVILTMDGFDVQYICALEKTSGKIAWRTDRSYPWGDLDGDLRKAYTTPFLAEVGGVPQLLSSGAKATYSYDARNGKELWRVRYNGFSNAARPVAGHGLAYINTGFGKADLWAVRLDGAGDVTDSHVVWKKTQGIPLKPSPSLVGDLLFMASDQGVATCLDARTGEQVWQNRLGGQFTASPIQSGDRVYFFNENGKAFVVRAARNFEVIAESSLEGGLMASPAAAGKALYLRTKTHLYRIEE